MRESLTLQDIQKVCLSILERAHTFCISKVKKDALELSLSIPFGSTKHVAGLAFLDFPAKRKHLLSEDFEESVFLEFEGHHFCARKGYDRVLRTIYGDYMQFPPEDQRQFQHSYRFFGQIKVPFFDYYFDCCWRHWQPYGTGYPQAVYDH